MTRKLRAFTRGLLRMGKVDKEKSKKIRGMIRAKKFRSRRHLNDSLEEL